MTKQKAVVLLSGGIDSTTCLAMAVDEHGADSVTALTMYYGQRHEVELNSARDVAAYYGVHHIEKDLSTVFEFDKSPLRGGAPVPEGSYGDAGTHDEDGMATTYVAFRNGVFLATAASIAYALGASEVYYGAHADDATGNAYPDCTVSFYQSMHASIYEGTGKKVGLHAPLVNENKAGVVEIGLRLGAPYHLTWTCYNGGLIPCGKCTTCTDRIKAFKLNGTVDPVEYA